MIIVDKFDKTIVEHQWSKPSWFWKNIKNIKNSWFCGFLEPQQSLGLPRQSLAFPRQSLGLPRSDHAQTTLISVFFRTEIVLTILPGCHDDMCTKLHTKWIGNVLEHTPRLKPTIGLQICGFGSEINWLLSQFDWSNWKPHHWACQLRECWLVRNKKGQFTAHLWNLVESVPPASPS